MANKFQVKRTTVSGRTPNTTNIANLSFIDTGELAINLTDKKMVSSDGTNYFEIGANLVGLNVTGIATISNTVAQFISANGSYGSAGYMLVSSGSAANAYWTAPPSGTVTSVASGNGISGGPVTSTGTLSIVANSGLISNTTGVFVNANTGIVANSTGAFVNSAYIATISANNSAYLGGTIASGYQTTAGLAANVAILASNNSTYLNGQLASYYLNATNIASGTLPYAQIPANIVNTSSAFTITGVYTHSANIILSAGLSANGAVGTAGQILTSGGSGSNVYWTAAGGSGTVTNIATGNGLSGGPITTTGTLAVVANSGIVANSTGTFVNANTGIIANATGTFVNSAYIATISANNTTYLNGQLASYYLNATNIASGTLPYAQIPANITNTTSNFTIAGVYTHSANLILQTGLSANGAVGTAGQVLTSGGSGSNVYWTAAGGTGTVTNIATGNGLSGGPITTTGTASVLANSGIVANSTGTFVNANSGLLANSTGLFVNANTGVVANSIGVFVNSAYIATISANNSAYLGGTIASGYQTTAGLSANVATLSANNTTYLNGQLASYYLTATNIASGTLPYAQIPANIVNTTSAFTITGVYTHSANLVLSTGLSANGSVGAAAQVLTSAGSGSNVYWTTPTTGTVTSVGSGNGLTGGAITSTGSLSVVANSGIVANTTGTFVNANTGIVANATGVFVNSAYIATISANNTTYLNGQLASYYLNATNIASGTLPYAQIPANIVNTTSSFTIAGVLTHSANVILQTGLSANGAVGTLAQVLASGGSGSNVYWTSVGSGTVTNIATGNGLTGGPITATGTASVLANSGIVANSTGTFVNANSGLLANSTGVFVVANSGLVSNATGVFVNANTGIVANATGVYAASYMVNTSSAFTYAGVQTHNANIVLGTTAGFNANGTIGTAGQILISNGTTSYWAGNTQPYDIAVFYPGTPLTSEIMCNLTVPRAVTFQANFAGSVGSVGANATATFVMVLKKNGASVGTVTVNTVGGFAFANTAAINMVASDILSIVAPVSTDATISNISVTFTGTRTTV